MSHFEKVCVSFVKKGEPWNLIVNGYFEKEKFSLVSNADLLQFLVGKKSLDMTALFEFLMNGVLSYRMMQGIPFFILPVARVN